MKTLSQVMAVSLPEFISAVEHGSLNSDFAKQSIYVGSHPALAITGGDLEYADTIGGDSFLLVFGHQFDGVYSTGGGTATQKYSESVRQFNFKLGQSGSQAGTNLGILDVELMGVYPPISRTRPVEETEQYHRRDLTVLPLLAPDGSNRIAALGGVFVPGQMAGFVNPVFITGDGSKQTQSVNLSVDTSISQLMSQYEVATVPVYSQTQKTMYTTFFAGISQYYWKDGKLNHDTPNFNISPPVDGLPFINSISTLKVDSSGSGQYLHNSETFPPATAQPSCGGTAAPYLGAETVFVAAKGVLDSNEVIQLESVSQSTVVGYLVGGIAATAPYPGDKTCASPTYYEVTLVPHKATDTTLLSMP
jgi:hypothetical protein